MATSRIATPARCAACQRSILELFSGLHLQRTRPLAVSKSHAAPALSRRAFHRTQRILSSDPPQQSRTESLIEQQSPEEDGAGEHAMGDAHGDTSIPWYLRDKGVQADTSPIAHKQRLPKLPPNPPPMLDALLKHLSIDIGLDYLNLLDLRKIDPPPAFGANLFMIFGTARSEKHLNVSADRLCRWLRTEYKLTPYADGLLGRQELKLKLRRKARRSKMLSAAGAYNPGSLQLDDGTRTGWVCVDVGNVSAPVQADVDDAGVDDGFVGFGRSSEGVKIVIHMMTEEKRVELDLEALWQSMLNASIRRQKAIEDGEQPLEPAMPPIGDRETRRSAFVQNLDRRPTVRAFHTSAFRRNADGASPAHPSQTNPDLAEHLIDFEHTDLAVEDKGLAKDLSYLKSLDRETAIAALGSDQRERESTRFLKDFFGKMPPFRTTDHWHAHLILHRSAIDVGHARYNGSYQWQLLKDMEASCVPIPARTFLFVLDAILRSNVSHIPAIEMTDYKTSTIEDHEARHLPSYSSIFTAIEQHLHMAFDTLERMESHGHPRLPLHFFLNLHGSVSSQHRVSLSERQALQLRYYRAVKQVFPPDAPLPRPLVLDMLRKWGAQRSWRGFWWLWRDMALEGFARDADMYATLFASIAAEGSEAHSRRAVTEWLPEMARERPPVQMDERIAVGVLRCLRNVGFDPRAESNGHLSVYAELWERCWRAAQLDREPVTVAA